MKFFIAAIILMSARIFSQVNFDADFESGNLNSVTTTDDINFNVTSKTDIGGRWFYFRISGIKDKFIKVTIENSDVNRPFYSYNNKTFERFTEAESPSINVFQKTFEEDTVFVAYYYPYNYSFLQQRISDWKQSEFIKCDTLGFTPNNFPMQELIITDFSVPDENKYKVWIHARTHPGETPSSWHMDGIIETLLSDNEVISHYRKNIIFYLYPFNNPEGVYYGRSRTNYFGVDQERDWNYLPAETTTEVSILKNRMLEVNSGKPISVFLNLHSQASPFCTFWIHKAASTSDHFYRREYQFSNLNTSDNPYFQQDDYSESNLQPYFPEGWLWNNYNDNVMALTYETPYDRYSNGDWVTNENLFEIGKRTVYSIAEYFELSMPKYLILDNKNAFVSGNYTSSAVGLNFYSDDYFLLESGNKTASATFTSEILPAGKYDIYGWWQEQNDFSYATNFEISAGFDEPVVIEKTQRLNGGQWNFLTEYKVTSPASLQINVPNNLTGKVAADAFRIIFREPITDAEENIIPLGFKLFQNYPNPFNPSTTIKFSVPSNMKSEMSNVKLIVYNSLGQQVAELLNKPIAAGNYEMKFDGKNLTSGVYFYQLKAGNFSETKKMMLVK